MAPGGLIDETFEWFDRFNWTMRALRVSVVLLLGAVAALSPAAASAKTHKPKPCAVPHGWRVAARDSPAVVIRAEVIVAAGGASEREERWRYCVRTNGRFRNLVTNTGVDGGSADILRVNQVALAGSFAAYDSNDVLGGGRYGISLGVDVTNLLTGTDTSARVLGVGFDHVLLAPPLAVWTSDAGGSDWFVQAFDGRTDVTTTLDSTSGPDSDPFADLQLDHCVAGCTPIGATFAWWTAEGSWRSGRIA